MLRSLREVQADDSVVGFYQATTLGAFFNQSLVETQAIHQDKLRHGGVVVIHGQTEPLCIGEMDSPCSRHYKYGARECVFPRLPLDVGVYGCV